MSDPIQVLHDGRVVANQAQQLVARVRKGGRPRASKPTSAHAWSVSQLADWIGMSKQFVRNEIKAKELQASTFGGEYRIPTGEVVRYLEAKGWPTPQDARVIASA